VETLRLTLSRALKIVNGTLTEIKNQLQICLTLSSNFRLSTTPTMTANDRRASGVLTKNPKIHHAKKISRKNSKKFQSQIKHNYY
jgi:hypothetical protein